MCRVALPDIFITRFGVGYRANIRVELLLKSEESQKKKNVRFYTQSVRVQGSIYLRSPNL